MEEKREEALRQISQIKSHLIDKEMFFPYNYSAVYVWAVLISILTVAMMPLYQESLWQGALFSFVLITIGFITEGLMTKRINKNYDIQECTRRQEFIMKNFLFLSLFVMLLSVIFASFKLYIVMFLSWLFLISLGYFAVGFVLNIRRFTKMAEFNICLSLFLLILGFLTNNLLVSEGIYLYFVQAMTIIGLAVLPSIVAWRQQKEECCV